MEVRKKWQHCRTHRLDGVTSRRLASTSTYAAVPPNDCVRQTGTQQGQVPARVGTKAPAQPADQTARCDVVDETVTSWLPDDARRGCHGYADVSEGEDDAHQQQQQQQQRGRDAMCMTRLDRH